MVVIHFNTIMDINKGALIVIIIIIKISVIVMIIVINSNSNNSIMNNCNGSDDDLYVLPILPSASIYSYFCVCVLMRCAESCKLSPFFSFPFLFSSLRE